MRIKLESSYDNTYRNQSVISQYDLNIANNIVEEIDADFNLPEKWKLGVIVGNSGTGKTSIAKNLFGYSDKQQLHPQDKSVLDLFDTKLSIGEISKMLTKVGFASPKSWLKPYHVLSNGEKMRVDLALELLSDKQLIVFDEFTSVVDREVAKTMCMVLNKVLQGTSKQIILVSCHFDILNYLDTDWMINTNSMEIELGKKKDYSENWNYTDVQGIIGNCLVNTTI